MLRLVLLLPFLMANEGGCQSLYSGCEGSATAGNWVLPSSHPAWGTSTIVEGIGSTIPKTSCPDPGQHAIEQQPTTLVGGVYAGGLFSQPTPINQSGTSRLFQASFLIAANGFSSVTHVAHMAYIDNDPNGAREFDRFGATVWPSSAPTWGVGQWFCVEDSVAACPNLEGHGNLPKCTQLPAGTIVANQWYRTSTVATPSGTSFSITSTLYDPNGQQLAQVSYQPPGACWPTNYDRVGDTYWCTAVQATSASSYLFTDDVQMIVAYP